METTDFGITAVVVVLSVRTVATRRQGHASDSGLRAFLPPPPAYHHLLICSMAPVCFGSWPRLVGRPLLYSISAFASLGVFLVSNLFLPSTLALA